MKRTLAAIFILSLLDALLTYTGIKAGYIEEANPIFRNTFNSNPEFALLAITVFLSVMLYIINRFGCRLKFVKAGLAALLAEKLLVIVIHIGWISMVI